MEFKQKVIVALLFSAMAGLTLISTVVHLLTELWWFEAIGFDSVFKQRVIWQTGIWIATFAIFVGFIGFNYWLALRLTGDRAFRFLESSEFEPYTDKIAGYITFVLIFLISLAISNISSASWSVILKFFNVTNFELVDPIYQQDLGFYLFRLPLLDNFENWVLTLLIAGLVITVLVYIFKGLLLFDWKWKSLLIEPKWQKLITKPIKTHLSFLLAAIAIDIAVDFWLERYELLYSSGGVVWGADYTDTHARLFAFWVMIAASVLLGLWLIIATWSNKLILPIYGIVVYAAVLILVNGTIPQLQQRFIVEPNELAKEIPYIKHNIEFTRQAYNLDKIETKNYQLSDNFNPNIIRDNQATIDNIRLWDSRPLLSTYRQLQEIRFYYKFNDVDVDRYTLNGDYRQVMLSSREFDYDEVPSSAKTWVNQRLKYTHGYGLVMNPVNEVTVDGLPVLFIKNIPPVSQGDLTIKEPAIYYGELTQDYIYTGMNTSEFDYPRGDENAFTKYDGLGGVAIDSWWRRLVYAYDRGSLKILISNYFTPNSRIHYYREISQRVSHVAPFLKLDNDPYMVVIKGRLKWIIDAYTTSTRYPYSEAVAHEHNTELITNKNTNYVRNPVKVVVDAKDGTMQFYVVDEDEPVLATYRKIFPDLFQGKDTIPTEVEAHFRYPQDLFEIQAQMYLSYHMEDPQVFYNREDDWRFATELYDGQQQQVEPDYLIMKLPGETQEEFALVLPFTPVNRDNMISWMAARSDGDNYGKLRLYEFPKQELVYGPFQIEARIDQNPEIAEQITLWSQRGSRVIRGDILVIPIDGSILYVQPLYLRAEKGELPELTRIITAYNKQIVMTPSLEQSLAVVFNQSDPSLSIPAIADSPNGRSALEIYQKAQQAFQRGNWVEYGQYQQQLQNILQNLP
ncbi:UPF0182 family protein [Waterburya agarophytonicola K14]|uniref:UPF0182 protein I4641_01400 n=1 Tax=Waterburya agarophytonicola KI4 TaxID=2874699 RepID=A0A964BLL5_9CYAN|nr:UPF0182 family protein [Waterburya agarophytonicola]MCC0175635.1 UPF0182 family protein [Waterburya agarophytonicola KI4]